MKRRFLRNFERGLINYSKPLVWDIIIVHKAREEGKISNDFQEMVLVEKISDLRRTYGDMLNYNWICVPLVYTQVVRVEVYNFLIPV